MAEILRCNIQDEDIKIRIENIPEIMKVLEEMGSLDTIIQYITVKTEILETMKELIEKGLVVASDLPQEQAVSRHKEWIKGNKKLLKILDDLSCATILSVRGI